MLKQNLVKNCTVVFNPKFCFFPHTLEIVTFLVQKKNKQTKLKEGNSGVGVKSAFNFAYVFQVSNIVLNNCIIRIIFLFVKNYINWVELAALYKDISLLRSSFE